MLLVRCPVCLSVCQSVCDVGVLWPNGWTDQDETRHAGKPRPWPHCARWGPSSPSPKGAQPPLFGPYLLRPNGCMDQDVTWCGARPRPRRLCVRWGPRCPLPKRGGPPKFSAHVYCDQTAHHDLTYQLLTDATPTKIVGGFSQNRYAYEFPGPFDSADGTTLFSKLLPQSNCTKLTLMLTLTLTLNLNPNPTKPY